jgi:hypothetical protein
VAVAREGRLDRIAENLADVGLSRPAFDEVLRDRFVGRICDAVVPNARTSRQQKRCENHRHSDVASPHNVPQRLPVDTAVVSATDVLESITIGDRDSTRPGYRGIPATQRQARITQKSYHPTA